MEGRKGAWALPKDAVLIKGQTWAALQSMHGILTDFEPLKLSLIAHNSDTEQTKLFGKISLVLALIFLFPFTGCKPLWDFGQIELVDYRNCCEVLTFLIL